MLTVNESGLYALIFRSRKPQAKVFRRWVTSQVLPALRTQGWYGMPGSVPAAAFPVRAPIAVMPPTARRHVENLETEHVSFLFAAALADEAAFWSGTIKDLAAIACARRLLHWRCRDAADYQDRAELAMCLRRRLGLEYSIGTARARLSVVGLGRGRRYILTRIDGEKERPAAS